MAVARNIAERRLMEEEARANTRKVIESLGQTSRRWRHGGAA
jgi:hypothetical protein